MEIKDWSVAREVDIAAAIYIRGEEMKREIEREKRDRDFWVMMFGGEPREPSDEDGFRQQVTLEDAMAKSPLGRNW